MSLIDQKHNKTANLNLDKIFKPKYSFDDKLWVVVQRNGLVTLQGPFYVEQIDRGGKYKLVASDKTGELLEERFIFSSPDEAYTAYKDLVDKRK